jgi:predicted AAA+ superfamily ATPase
MVLKRLAGKAENTSPVLAQITQSGGGKTHTLTTLYYPIKHSYQLEEKERFKKLTRDLKTILDELGLSGKLEIDLLG